MSREESFEEIVNKLLKEVPKERPVRALSLEDIYSYMQKKLDKANGLAERFQELALIRHEVIIELERVKKELESENAQLKQTLKLAVEVIGFYGDKSEWYQIRSGISDYHECFNCDLISNGFDKARQFLQSEQYQKVKGGI